MIWIIAAVVIWLGFGALIYVTAYADWSERYPRTSDSEHRIFAPISLVSFLAVMVILGAVFIASAFNRWKTEVADPTVTVMKVSCPADTDFEPTVQLDVTWTLHPERGTVAVNVYPCVLAESIINQGKAKLGKGKETCVPSGTVRMGAYDVPTCDWVKVR